MKVCELNNVKLLAAVAGGAAAVALGVFGAVYEPAMTSGSQVLAKTTHMTVGQTTTSTTVPNAPETSMAVPAIKGNTPPSGFAANHH
ncbi:hypothetical protein M2272_004124 [Mycobacterium frederiksbergense]|uniref:DUF2613 family protein n=1 Tax=Mycolicibacterium frederiksbergense TaxID=117567 RepID=A0ABT6L3G4_9MYCO|nr:hypothetical protein [Mycolicibacterium frederiksbergense]MDH6197469.1 hypothetical protein [Mycolicibacterium frederiksbergense]